MKKSAKKKTTIPTKRDRKTRAIALYYELRQKGLSHPLALAAVLEAAMAEFPQ